MKIRYIQMQRKIQDNAQKWIRDKSYHSFAKCDHETLNLKDSIRQENAPQIQPGKLRNVELINTSIKLVVAAHSFWETLYLEIPTI